MTHLKGTLIGTVATLPISFGLYGLSVGSFLISFLLGFFLCILWKNSA